MRGIKSTTITYQGIPWLIDKDRVQKFEEDMKAGYLFFWQMRLDKFIGKASTLRPDFSAMRHNELPQFSPLTPAPPGN